MNEEQIAAMVAQNKPQVQEQPVIAPAPKPAIDNQSSMLHDEPSELSLFRLGQSLGIDSPSFESSDKIKFIYDKLASTLENKSEENVLNALFELTNMIGITHEPNKFLRVYQWLRLNEERLAVERAMEQV